MKTKIKSLQLIWGLKIFSMKYATCIGFIILFSTCTKSHDESINIQPVQKISINFDDASDELLMSEFFSGLQYIHLSTPDAIPIGRIRKIMVQDENLALYDEARKSIWIFSHTGEFISKIDIPEGRGPGEITQMNDVFYSDDGLVHALGAFKIVVYNLEGVFVRETSFDFFIYKFIYDSTKGKYIGYAGNSLNTQLNNEHSGHNLLFFNEKGEITHSSIPIPNGREHMKFGVSNRFPSFDSNQKFFPHLSDTVYTIYETNVIPRFILDYNENAIPESVFERRENYSRIVYEWVEFSENELINNNYVTFLFFFNETERFIHFRVGAGSNYYNIFFDKDNNITNVGPGRLTNDFDHAPVPFIYDSSDKALYSIIEANDLLRHLNDLYRNNPQKYSHPNTQKLVQLARSFDDNSNPILQIARFKE